MGTPVLYTVVPFYNVEEKQRLFANNPFKKPKRPVYDS